MFHLAVWESILKIMEADKKGTMNQKAHFSTTYQCMRISVERKRRTPLFLNTWRKYLGDTLE